MNDMKLVWYEVNCSVRDNVGKQTLVSDRQNIFAITRQNVKPVTPFFIKDVVCEGILEYRRRL